MGTEKNLFSLQNKVAIVTGGAGLLGSRYVAALREAGATVVVWDKADANPVDITDEAQVQQAASRVAEKYGRIDILVNNAAMAAPLGDANADKQFVPYENYPLSLWEQELKVNLTGTMLCTKAVAPFMMRQKSGSIINIASEVSVIAHDHRVYGAKEDTKFKSIAYATTKAAVLGFTRQWAARLGAYNVRVNTFSPTGVRTDAQPADFVERYASTTMLGRMATPDEYNGAILFLASDASAFITGHNLIADGGKSAW
jgi:NAD(P)-dependent dehydrogenase (short-subunit alcohol dehydrogenase family)